MTTNERRQVPRKLLERLAYIEIEPNNGGIVLNASDEGLCFHSIAPVERNGPVRFSLLDHNRRIDVRGELIWTDDMRKVGGLRFNSLSADAREGINEWIAQPQSSEEENRNSTFKFAMVRAFRSLGVPRFDRPGAGSASATVGFGGAPVPGKLRGFSGGLVTGFLLSTLLATIFASSYAHRRELGKSLIHWGERLAATSEGQSARSVAPLAKASVIGRGEGVTSTAQSAPAAAQAPAVLSQPADLKPATLKMSTKATEPKPSPAVIDMIHRQPSPGRQAVKGGTREFAPPSASTLVAAATPDIASNLLKAPGAPPALELAKLAPIRGASSDPSSALSMYFDIGRFKDESSALNLSAKVGEFGLPTMVAKRGHLWANSYQVLVGPYRDQQEEKRLQNGLLSHGFKPRSFERGSRDFVFISPLVVRAARLPVGDLTIRWESFVGDAKVTFLQGGNLLTTIEGKWLPRAMKYWRDEYVFQRNGDGSRTLLEIHFSGLNRALVFRD